MKKFATFINQLDSSNKTSNKLAAIRQYLSEAGNADKCWFLALFTGKRPKRIVATAQLKQWAMEAANLPEWLFRESYAAVGDLGETIALILPEPTIATNDSLSGWIQKINGLRTATEEEKKQFITQAWKGLTLTEKFIFNKLLGGSFRVGVSSKTLINALAAEYGMEPNAVAHSIMGSWDVDNADFDGLIKGHYTNTNLSKPYPFCLAYPLENAPDLLGAPPQWQVEYKWDGIRAQLIKRHDEVFIWSRGEELITEQFPEITEALAGMAGNFVLDGELLAGSNQEVLNFSELQKRLNRKNITAKIRETTPVMLYAYDLLEREGADLRQQPLLERRKELEQLFAENTSSKLYLSPVINFSNWEALATIRSNSRHLNSEGLMLKKASSPYHTGRKKGDWWKWKLDALTLDAVLIYAQKGSGRRSAWYTDYTFAIRDGDKLVTIAKAYSGLTEKQIQEVSRFVTKNAVEKFGPVRTVKPELVFEIAFEGIGFSNRHKSGVALRFPRILRWRKDKTVAEIDDLETVKKMIR